MKSSASFVTVLAAICLAAATTAAADETPEPERRTKGFWSMDREDLHDWNFEIAGGGMHLDLQGRIGFETDFGQVAIGVQKLDLDKQWDGWIKAELKFAKKHHLRFVFLPVDFEGSTFIEVGLPVDDPIFTFDDFVRSRAKLYTYQLTYLYDFNIGKYLRLSPGLTLGVIDTKVRISDDTLGISFEENQPLPVPELGLRFEIFPVSRLTIFGELKGFTIGDKATVWDASSGLLLHVNRHIYFTGSYRAIDYDVDWLGAVINTRFHGPYLGAGIRF